MEHCLIESSEHPAFTYYRRWAMPDRLRETPLAELACKHTWGAYTSLSRKAKEMYERTAGACQWSSDDGTPHDMKHVRIIEKMESNGYRNAVRVVRAGEFTLVDNLHTAIRYAREAGASSPLGDIPFYLVDITSELPMLMTDGRMFRDGLSDMQGAVECGLRYRSYAERLFGGPEGAYTLGDFLDDHPVLLGEGGAA